MAAKKKTKKKQPKKVTRKKAKPVKKARKPKPAKKRAAGARKIAAGKTKRAPAKRVRGKSETVDTVAFAPEGLSPRYGGQSGDLQGLSSREGADSESVDELLEEGNAFEAEVVKGVQDADDEGEVRTHEVPEDDVPGEYRDKDE
jgi:outer membrane biosynthesis protein TonB